MLVVSFLLIVASSICLCFSFDKHSKKLINKTLDGRLKAALRIAGHVLLFASLVVAVVVEGYLGLVYWCGLFSLAAIPFPFIIAYLEGPIRLPGRTR